MSIYIYMYLHVSIFTISKMIKSRYEMFPWTDSWRFQSHCGITIAGRRFTMKWLTMIDPLWTGMIESPHFVFPDSFGHLCSGFQPLEPCRQIIAQGWRSSLVDQMSAVQGSCNPSSHGQEMHGWIKRNPSRPRLAIFHCQALPKPRCVVSKGYDWNQGKKDVNSRSQHPTICQYRILKWCFNFTSWIFMKSTRKLHEESW